jgi:Lrp/AsnC family leucine-responsive transcriptional regulator
MADDDVVLDHIDRTILTVLSEQGRIPFSDLAEQVLLSPNATADRVRRLERRGVIRGYRAELDLDVLGRSLVALVDVRPPLGADHEAFEQAILDHPAVVEALHLTGGVDYQLRVACRDVAELDSLLADLRNRHRAAGTETRLALRRSIAPLTFAPRHGW